MTHRPTMRPSAPRFARAAQSRFTLARLATLWLTLSRRPNRETVRARSLPSLLSRRGLLACGLTFLAAFVCAMHSARGSAQEPPAAVPATTPAAAPVGDVLRAISYNVQFLPGPAAVVNKRKDPVYRATRLGELLREYDLIALNEVFEDGPRQRILAPIREVWGEQMHVLVSPQPEGRYSGGLLIVSRLPFLETNTMIYENYSSPEKYGLAADGFAAKGVLHARVWRGEGSSPDDFIDVFCTHFEARDNSIRELQYQEMADFIGKHRDHRGPTLILGDLNTRGNTVDRDRADAPYHRLMAAFSAACQGAELRDIWLDVNPDDEGGTTEQEEGRGGGRRIDYILLANPASDAQRVRPLAMRVNPFRDPRVVALSDHSAVEADLRWPAKAD